MSFVATWLWVPEKPEGRADHLIVEALKNNWGEWNVEDPPSISRTQLKRLIESGLVRVNGVTIKCNSTLSEGVTVELNTLPVESVDVEPEDIPIEILYEDSHIAIVNKPAGMLTHPTRTESNGTLVNCLLFRLKDLSGIGAVSYTHLTLPTSG